MTFKEFLTKKGISEAAQKELSTEDIAKHNEEFMNSSINASVEKAKAEMITKIDEAIANAGSRGVTKEVVNSIIDEQLKQLSDNEVIKGLQQTILQLKENSSPSNGAKKTLSQELKEHSEKLALIAKGARKDEVVVKATVLRSNIANNDQAFFLPDIGQLAHQKLTAYDIFNRIPITGSNHNGTIGYHDWDQATTVRAANMIAEGGTFPESEAKWVYETIKLKKVGDTLPVTEEFFEDEASFAAELNMFLNTNVRIKINDQIINGDGTGQNLTGIFASINAYSPVASGIQDASIYDLILKVSEAITKPFGSKYMPDVALMNITDILRMKLKKDANNNYVTPPFVSQDGKQVGSMIVLEENAVPSNQMIVGDRRYARIYEMPGITLSNGYVNSQFTEDIETLKARARLLFLIRNVDKTGFLKVTDIDTALATLATATP